MVFLIILIAIFIIHILGGIIAIIIHTKNGVMEYAAKHGDGMRNATPSDVVFDDLIFWEVELFYYLCDSLDKFINHYFEEKYKKNEEDI